MLLSMMNPCMACIESILGPVHRWPLFKIKICIEMSIEKRIQSSLTFTTIFYHFWSKSFSFLFRNEFIFFFMLSEIDFQCSHSLIVKTPTAHINTKLRFLQPTNIYDWKLLVEWGQYIQSPSRTRHNISDELSQPY